MRSLPAEPSTAPGIETAMAGATAVFTVTVSLTCALYRLPAQSEAAVPEGTAITPLLESKDHRLASHQACLDSQCHMGAPSSALLTLRTRQDEDAMTMDCVTRGPSSFNTITLSNKQNLYCALSTVFREPKKV